MGFTLSAKDYTRYLERAASKIAESKDYITELDAATGDGDHWVNMNMGFEAIVKALPEIELMSMDAVFKKLGMIMMSVIGGSSGALYGGAYLAAAKSVPPGSEALDAQALCAALEAMLRSMMERGKSEPGFKTMIDALHPAAAAFRAGLDEGADEWELLQRVKQAAADGAQSTRDMQAVRGRACYQADKGVGHLDPGAVTMSYQIEALADYILENR